MAFHRSLLQEKALPQNAKPTKILPGRKNPACPRMPLSGVILSKKIRVNPWLQLIKNSLCPLALCG